MFKLNIIIISLLICINSYALDNSTDSNINEKEKINENIKDYFLDENGNVVEQNKIPSLKAEIGQWKILTTMTDDRKLCYAIIRPFAKIGNHKDLRDSYLMVIYTNRKKQDLNISMGFNLRKGSRITMSIDGYQFSMLHNGNVGLASYEKRENEIITKMLYGKKIMVKGDSIIGTYGVDAYDISDFKAVYERLIELCNFM